MWNLSPSFSIYLWCDLKRVTYIFWTSISWICFSSLEVRERKGQRAERKGKGPQDGLKLRTTACERTVEVPGGGGGRRTFWEWVQFLVFLCCQFFFVQICCLFPIKSAIPVKVLCELEVCGNWRGSFHIAVCVALNRNGSWGSSILESEVTVGT